MKKRLKLIVIFAMFLLVFSGLVLAIQPSGGTITSISNGSASLGDPGSVPAIAGNVTELNIVGYSTTQSWQGYYGNVSGTIQLADSNDAVLYNWSLANPEGEVYATVNSSVNWTGTSCWNMEQNGESLEGTYGVAIDDVDGINETFTLQNHDSFYVNNILIAENTCNSTRIFSNGGVQVDQQFEEVILEGGSGEVIFTALLEEASIQGFDGGDHDFEMIVLEDGHGTDTSTTPYYFYVELQ